MLIDTLHGEKYAALLILERIPFSVVYKIEFQASFRVPDENYKRALEILMAMRGSMLSG
jgi:hypothetical protein